jgi:dihydroorotase
MGVLNVQGGFVWRGNQFIKNEQINLQTHVENDQMIYLSDNSLIVPGLIDFHCHLFAPGAPIGVTMEEMLSSGVIACVDAGTFGYEGWYESNAYWRNSPLTIRSWLSVLPEGLTVHPNPNPTLPSHVSLARLIEVGVHAGTDCLGFKIRLGQVDDDTDRDLLQLARRAADECGLRMMVNLTETFLPLEEVLSYFKAGDVLTHPFHGKRGNVLDTSGCIQRSLFEAINRGVVLDLGHGRNHFTWRVFERCLAEGIKPDVISTDLTRGTWGKSPIHNLSYIVSKMVAGGLHPNEIFNGLLNIAPQVMGIQIPQIDKQFLILEAISEETYFPDVEGVMKRGNLIYTPTYIKSTVKS